MREIKFRAWDVAEKKFMDDDINLYTSWEKEITTFLVSGIGMGGIEIMQFTGLKDKNGKEIYEGDILRIDIPKEEQKDYGCEYSLFEVEIELNSWGINVHWNCIKGYECSTHVMRYGFEVIGNKFENPELMEGAS